ncbi:hypothetical protein JK363_11865 [Streptomyces sp. 205]|uniref:Uncharacterized protein n=1 Tax=Streptomyces coffeae TaxID=621382 RepID=A0ABS1NBV0_9ACTN|nr:hypothetical protein [Streptomyces coffeae]
MAAALVAGLVLGAGGVGAAWALAGDDSDTSGSGPAGDAHAACAAFDGFDETKWGAKGKEGDIAINRYSAAGTLANAAAAGDKRYKPLAEAISRSQNRYAQELEFTAKVKKDLDKVRGLCEDL